MMCVKPPAPIVLYVSPAQAYSRGQDAPLPWFPSWRTVRQVSRKAEIFSRSLPRSAPPSSHPLTLFFVLYDVSSVFYMCHLMVHNVTGVWCPNNRLMHYCTKIQNPVLTVTVQNWYITGILRPHLEKFWHWFVSLFLLHYNYHKGWFHCLAWLARFRQWKRPTNVPVHGIKCGWLVLHSWWPHYKCKGTNGGAPAGNALHVFHPPACWKGENMVRVQQQITVMRFALCCILPVLLSAWKVVTWVSPTCISCKHVWKIPVFRKY